MKSQEYWQKRSEQIAIRQYQKTDQYIANLKREYERAMQTIQQDVEWFYQRFADNNKIVNMAEARKLLTTGELKEFKMTLEEFTALAKDNRDGRWTKVLNNVYYKTRVSRFEALQIQINQQIEMLTELQHRGTEALLGEVYTDTYYRTLFEIQRGTGIGATFAKIDEEGLNKVLGTEFAGSNWSKRIWGDRDKLSSEIYTRLSQSFIRGDSIDRTTRIIAERMGVSYSSAARLVRTESAFFTEQATKDSYRECGVVQKYEVLATLDSRTSSICRGMDGMIFKLSEMEVGVNYPPFHANCRTTTMPYFDDGEDPGERIAKDSSGKTVYVPGDMKYQEWYNKYAVSSSDYSMLIGKKTVNNIEIKSIADHLIERGKERPFTPNDLLEAFISPLDIREVIIDKFGRPSQRFTGSKATVNINPETGMVVTAWKTGKDKLRKYSKKEG